MPDHGFGRRPFMAPQSHQWNIAPFMAANPATRYRLLPWPDARFEVDQADSGACTAASLLKIIGGKPMSHSVKPLTKRIGPREPVETDPVRRLIMMLYRMNVTNDAWPDNNQEANPSAYPRLSDLVSGSSVDAAMKTGRNYGYWKEFRWCRSHDEADQWIRRADGSPLMAGLNWYESMFTPDHEGILRISGKVAGGHAIRVGFHDRKRGLWLLTNSWGRSWSLKGNAWLSDEDFDRLCFREDGELACAIETVGSPPSTTPEAHERPNGDRP